MIGYVTLGARDLRRAATFHEALPAGTGARRSMALDQGDAWGGPAADKPRPGVLRLDDGRPAGVGNSLTVARSPTTRDAVDRPYRAALELAAADEGPDGHRGPGFGATRIGELDSEIFLNLFRAG